MAYTKRYTKKPVYKKKRFSKRFSGNRTSRSAPPNYGRVIPSIPNELKSRIGSHSPDFPVYVTPTTSGEFNNIFIKLSSIFDLSKGTSHLERIGNQVFCKQVKLRYILGPADALPLSSCRVCVFLTNRTNNISPSDFFDISSFTTLRVTTMTYNFNRRAFFTVLHDKVYTFTNTYNRFNTLLKSLTFNINKVLQYETTDTPTSWQLVFLAVADRPNFSLGQLQIGWQHIYTDS